MINLKDKKNIFWDFDGVLMDSMPVRNKGFESVLKNYPKGQVDKLMQFHFRNGGLSRYVKFRYFFEDVLQTKVTDEEVNNRAQEFSEVMRKELIAPELLIQDSLQFVKNNYKNYQMHIVSGSDQEELRFLCSALDISKYFISIHGSPAPKKELIKKLLKDHEYSLRETVLIGDSVNDLDAAVENNIEFYGYNNLNLKARDGFYIERFTSL